MRGFFHGSILAIATGLWGLSANDASADYVIYTDTTISYSVYAVDVGRAGPRGTFSTSPTVTIVPGGDVSSGGISNVALQSFNSSTVNVVGGHVDGIWAWDSSAINVGFGARGGGRPQFSHNKRWRSRCRRNHGRRPDDDE